MGRLDLQAQRAQPDQLGRKETRGYRDQPDLPVSPGLIRRCRDLQDLQALVLQARLVHRAPWGPQGLLGLGLLVLQGLIQLSQALRVLVALVGRLVLLGQLELLALPVLQARLVEAGIRQQGLYLLLLTDRQPLT